MSNQQELMIVVGVPAAAVEAVLEAVARAGGGVLGHYTRCAFVSSGTGCFQPDAAASPHIGERERLNWVDEMRVETFCSRAVARAVVAAIRAAHPYEEPVIYIIPLLSEADL